MDRCGLCQCEGEKEVTNLGVASGFNCWIAWLHRSGTGSGLVFPRNQAAGVGGVTDVQSCDICGGDVQREARDEDEGVGTQVSEQGRIDGAVDRTEGDDFASAIAEREGGGNGESGGGEVALTKEFEESGVKRVGGIGRGEIAAEEGDGGGGLGIEGGVGVAFAGGKIVEGCFGEDLGEAFAGGKIAAICGDLVIFVKMDEPLAAVAFEDEL